MVGLGDGPCGAAVGQAHGDESAQVQGGDSVVQPVIVFGHSAVADFAVVAREPGDGAFDHGAMLAVFGLPVRITREGPGGTQPLFMRADGEVASACGGGAPLR